MGGRCPCAVLGDTIEYTSAFPQKSRLLLQLHSVQDYNVIVLPKSRSRERNCM